MRNWKRSAALLTVLAALLSGHAASGQSKPTERNSANGSASSATRAEGAADPIAACRAAADELGASRRLIELLEHENTLLKERIVTESRASALASQLSETRRAENEALRSVIAAKNEALAAKDGVIAGQDKLIETLRSKRASPWKRIGDVLIGVAAGMLMR